MTQDRNRSRYLRSVTSRQRDYSESPDAIVMSVTDIHASGRYLCKKDHWPTAILVPVRPMGARLPYPGRHTVYFEDGDRGRPFLLWTRPEREAWPVLDGGQVFFDWLRVGARASYRWYVPDWDDPEAEGTSITFASGSGLELQDGSIVRTSADGILYWADGNNLCHLNLSAPTEDPVVTDLGAEIIAMSLCELSSRSYSITQTYVEGDATPDYTAGINAAEALFAEGGAFYENEADPCSQGANDCTGELGYRAVELADAYLLGDYAPPEGESEDFVNGWIDGFKAYFKAQYDPCYEGGGCTIPEG